jgi:hypothetical protein
MGLGFGKDWVLGSMFSNCVIVGLCGFRRRTTGTLQIEKNANDVGCLARRVRARESDGRYKVAISRAYPSFLITHTILSRSKKRKYKVHGGGKDQSRHRTSAWCVLDDVAENQIARLPIHGASALGESWKSCAYSLHDLGLETTAKTQKVKDQINVR